MPWEYSQSTGTLTRNGVTYATGYSGTGTGRNNPDQQDRANVGPIPRGDYTIGPSHNGPHTGPQTMNLDPVGHNAEGRTAFRIHGDNATHDASNGCIIIPPDVRGQISRSGDHALTVVR